MSPHSSAECWPGMVAEYRLAPPPSATWRRSGFIPCSGRVRSRRIVTSISSRRLRRTGAGTHERAGMRPGPARLSSPKCRAAHDLFSYHDIRHRNRPCPAPPHACAAPPVIAATGSCSVRGISFAAVAGRALSQADPLQHYGSKVLANSDMEAPGKNHLMGRIRKALVSGDQIEP